MTKANNQEKSTYRLIESDILKIRILRLLLQKGSLTPYRISILLKPAQRTVKRSLFFLEIIGLVQKEEIHLTDKKKIERYSLTHVGKTLAKELKNTR